MIFYRERAEGVTNAGTQVTLALQQVYATMVRIFRSISFFNNSGETVTAQIGILEGSDFFPLQPKQTVATGDGMAVVQEVIVYELQKVAVQVTGTSLKSTIILYAEGREVILAELDPPPVAGVIEQESKTLRGY